MMVREIVSEAVRDRVIQMLNDAESSVRPRMPLEPGVVEFEDIEDLARGIWHEVRSLNLDEVRLTGATPDTMVAAHTVNRTVLAMRIARDLDLSGRVIDLGIAALICDLGMFAVQSDILDTPGPLEPEKMSEVKRHVTYTLAGLTAGRSWNAYIKTAIAHHHEREDGSGYPGGLTSGQIHPLGKILAVADMFSAMIQHRPHRTRLEPHEVLDYMVSGAGFEFDGDAIRSLYEMVPPYPIGTSVTLNTGATAVVVRVSGKLKHRPVVRVVNNGTVSEQEIDLTRREHQNCVIVTATAG